MSVESELVKRLAREGAPRICAALRLESHRIATGDKCGNRLTERQ